MDLRAWHISIHYTCNGFQWIVSIYWYLNGKQFHWSVKEVYKYTARWRCGSLLRCKFLQTRLLCTIFKTKNELAWRIKLPHKIFQILHYTRVLANNWIRKYCPASNNFIAHGVYLLLNLHNTSIGLTPGKLRLSCLLYICTRFPSR